MIATTRRRYTAQERAAVVADVAVLGVSGAARKHGVAQSCVSRWARQRAENEPVATPEPQRVVAPEPQRVVKPEPQRVVTPEPPRVAAPEPQPVATPEPQRVAAAPEPQQQVTPEARSRRVTARRYTPSQKAEVLEYAAAHGVSEAAEKFGVSRFSIYDWKGRTTRAAKGEGSSPTSGPAPADVEAQRDREILTEWRRHPGLGPSQIVNQLRRAGVKVSVHTARQVMIEAGYRPPKVKREPHDERFEAVRPNHMWHLDFVHRYINRSSTFTLILIDDHSRFVTGQGVDDAERAGFVIETFERAVERYGRPEKVMNDKGSAFWSWRGISRFTALLTELEIDQIPAKHKQWNGKVEVFNGNLHKEFFDVQRFYDIAEMKRRLAAHITWYNHARTHHALGGLLVPADRYYGRVEEVLARIEAGVGRDASDWLELRNRCLELFKVTSRGGVPEVWLLGQRLLGATRGADSAGGRSAPEDSM